VIEQGPGDRASRCTRGFSLPELLAVLALFAIAIAIGIPLVNEQVRMAEVRAAAADLAVELRAARMSSVTRHTTIKFTVDVDENYFTYLGNNGQYRKITMPGRVRIAPASDRVINFKENGSVAFASSIILESDVSGSLERWTANVTTMGMPTLVHERVN
jgi:prepilin-type N-terminal cleavage/methylation domain-containing protein